MLEIGRESMPRSFKSSDATGNRGAGMRGVSKPNRFLKWNPAAVALMPYVIMAVSTIDGRPRPRRFFIPSGGARKAAAKAYALIFVGSGSTSSRSKWAAEVTVPGGPASQRRGRVSIWASIYPRLLELIRSHRSTLPFVNSPRLAERISGALVPAAAS